ncbi:MAG TPA: serine/threonine-protein kinase [Gemmataceae bacterium]|jgi:WD40 repeat protein/tRNA A-37 threonylcarbamoyl transferase component Bud32
MTQLLRCQNGHEWEVSAVAALSGGMATPCPVCGSLDKSHHLSTVLLPLPPEDLPASYSSSTPRLEDYEILGELGRGGMGIVYKARHLRRDRVIALKIFRKDRLTHPEGLRRFRREAQAAARLSHPNIVVVYESDQDGDTHFLAMEYVPGITLQTLVEHNGALPFALACDLMRQTSLGLQHAVEQALVHRDIKPSNLMLVAPNAGVPQAGQRIALPPRPQLKILDMGVARMYQMRDLDEESLTTLTRDGTVIGTPDYIAPEQLEDPHKADIRADLYSLGCTFYFLLAGRVPFPGGTLIQKLDRQRWENPPSVDQLRPEVPPPVASVVRKLMAKHPDDRYANPGELAAALEQLTRTGVLPAGHQPEPLRETRTIRAGGGPVVAVALLPDGRSLAAACADRRVRVFDLDSGKERSRFGPSPQEITCLAFAPSSGHLLTGQGASVRVWDAATGQEIARLTGHTNAVRCLAVSREGRQAISGGDDRTLRLWDLHSGREIQRFSGHRAEITSVALSDDGQHIVSGGRDQTLRLWDVRDGRETRLFPAPRGLVFGVAFAPGGRTFASGHFDTTIRLWEVETGRELRRFSGHRQMIAAVAATAGGRVISGSHDQTLRVWDPESGSELWCCRGHTAAVTALDVSADGRRIVSGSRDETIRMWQLPS